MFSIVTITLETRTQNINILRETFLAAPIMPNTSTNPNNSHSIRLTTIIMAILIQPKTNLYQKTLRYKVSLITESSLFAPQEITIQQIRWHSISRLIWRNSLNLENLDIRIIVEYRMYLILFGDPPTLPWLDDGHGIDIFLILCVKLDYSNIHDNVWKILIRRSNTPT